MGLGSGALLARLQLANRLGPTSYHPPTGTRHCWEETAGGPRADLAGERASRVKALLVKKVELGKLQSQREPVGRSIKDSAPHLPK